MLLFVRPDTFRVEPPTTSRSTPGRSTQPPSNSVVYRDADGYKAESADGTVLASGPDWADAVLQAPLDRYLLGDPASGRGPGDVYVPSAEFLLSPAFAAYQRGKGAAIHRCP